MTKQCVHCGAVGIITRDHVPPKGIFSGPRPNNINLITVPACERCHNAETSMDDEYFRLALQLREGTGEHPDAVKARPSLMRSLENPNQVKMQKRLLENIFLAEFVTPSGKFIKTQPALKTDMDRLNRVVRRTLKGLFYHEKRYRLPDEYDVLVQAEDTIQKWPAIEIAKVKETIVKPLLAQKAVTLGNGVFSYRVVFDKTDTNASAWMFIFYEHAKFLGLTLMPIKSV